MIVLWQELILGILIGCLIMIVWLAWDMTRWGELHIDLDIEELESDLYHGLHLHRGDD